MIIKYAFRDGAVTEVEVSDEIGAVIIDLDRQEYNVNHKEVRRHCSLDAFNLDDALFPSDDDVEAEVATKDEYRRLYAAIDQLSPRQQYLIRQVYFEGRKYTDIAREEGVDRTAISHATDRAIKNLKKILA
jgi:RNA polymerase sigma factor (sigma-70 family)